MDAPKKPLKIAIIGAGRTAADVVGALTSGGPLKPTAVIHEDDLPPPDLTGVKGRAWLCDEAALSGGKPHAGIGASYVIEARTAHPMWHSYIVLPIHLRRYEGDPGPPQINVAGATHEFQLYALNPEHPRAPAIRGKAFPRLLTPGQFAAQFIADSDAAAAERIRLEVVQAVLNGELSPDTDDRRAWVARWGGAMVGG